MVGKKKELQGCEPTGMGRRDVDIYLYFKGEGVGEVVECIMLYT